MVHNKKEVISIIELKYLPRAQPRYKKDLENLSYVTNNRTRILIANDRFRGAEIAGIEYCLSITILFVWASVHAKDKSESNQLYSADYKSLGGCYLELHAETKPNLTPEIFQRTASGRKRTFKPNQLTLVCPKT